MNANVLEPCILHNVIMELMEVFFIPYLSQPIESRCFIESFCLSEHQ